MKIKHQGLHAHRLKENPREALFATAWETENKNGRLLDYLLHPGAQSGRVPPLQAGERDRVVAATVVQWLGSEVGGEFLRGLGYERKP